MQEGKAGITNILYISDEKPHTGKKHPAITGASHQHDAQTLNFLFTMSGAPELSAISTAFTVSLRITEKMYEIIAVKQEAKDLLEITSRTTTKLDQAKVLRRQKSALLSVMEKSMISDAFTGAEKAIETVAKLIEPARADLEVSGGREAGKVRFMTRMQFVFRDTAQIPVSLQKLTIASNDLNMAITTLNLKEPSRQLHPEGYSNLDLKVPPTYEESEFLHRARERNMRRRESMMSLRSRRQSASVYNSGAVTPAESIAELPDNAEITSKLASISIVGETPDFIDGSNGLPMDELLLEPPPLTFRARSVSRDTIANPFVHRARMEEQVFNVSSAQEAPNALKTRSLSGQARSRAWMERRIESTLCLQSPVNISHD